MPGTEEEAGAGVLEALGELVRELRATRTELKMHRDEIGELRKLFAKIEAKPPERPILEREIPIPGPTPGTVPAAQILQAGASFVRALQSGGRKKKKRSSDD